MTQYIVFLHFESLDIITPSLTTEIDALSEFTVIVVPQSFHLTRFSVTQFAEKMRSFLAQQIISFHSMRFISAS